ncbi:Serine/threonine kinase [Coemansia interrupta]|uniref:protein kinase C n=1 Tax=Coemansia interrupta TaxID=1126814 RepID=A0A9W8LLQ5_9FUNG|nr:Serine/threonine kinase [Coemansia interrupta]
MQASSIAGHTGDLDSAISKVREGLEKERKMLEKTRQMVTQTNNPMVKANAQSMIAETEQRVSYLEAEFRRLSQKRDDKNSIKSGAPSFNESNSPASTSVSEKSGGRPHSLSMSKIDLRKTSTHLSVQKISLKVHEIAYKLEVERKIRDQANRIRSIYSNDYHQGSRDKIAQITDSDRLLHETNDRIRLLEYSLKMYQSLHVDYADDDETLAEDEYSGGMFQAAIRRPITGKLQLRIHRAKNLRRALLQSRSFRSPQQFVVVKIDGKACGTTPIVRDSVFNYYFEIEVKKASEVELSIFERGDKDYLVGLMWVRMSEIYEDIRKREVMAESSGGWATADQVARTAQQHPQHPAPYGSPSPSVSSLSHPGSMSPAPPRPSDGLGPGILSEWDVESQGQIELWMNFIKDTTKRRQQSRLGRKAAVRKRRGQCVEMCGHHFYELHTYSIMKCAICGDHIVNETGQQCDDCRLFVHKNCVNRVVTHCHFQTDGAEEAVELGHRIPHRWDNSTNMGANWCCHCGNMLSIGRRACKCTECSLSCHSGCKQYVPNLCGLDMAKASAMILEIKRAKGSIVQPKLLTKRDTMAKKPGHEGTLLAPSADDQVAQIQNRLENMKPPSVAAGIQQQNYMNQQSPSPIPQRLGQGGAMAPGGQRPNSNEFVPIKSGAMSPPPHQQQQLQQQRPQAPADHRLSQAGAYAQNVVQPPSYYQQQIQQAKNYAQIPPQHQNPQYGYGQPSAGYPPNNYQQMPQPRMDSMPQHMSPQQQQQQLYQQQQQQHQMQMQQQQQQHMQMQQQQQYGRQSLYGGGAPPPQHQSPQSAAPSISLDSKQQIYQAMQQPPAQQQQLVVQPNANQPPRKVGINDFKFLKVLGKGNFGKVMLSEEKGTSKLYAIKVLKKEFIVENDEFESTRSEKRVLLIANKERHPFLIGLHSCFQTSNHIFFVMEYISGGDLMMHVQKLGTFGERRAKFFACEILLGLAYFHKAGIIYRDLKLDNILLDKEGHVKIADYGLCKENMGYGQTTITFCGTPEFMAPEIVLEQRYGRAVDWWAFGVLIYEMILGTSPFHGEDENEIFESILEDEILYPVRMSRDSVFICQALLEKEPSKRLGSGPNDAEDIMKHSFFAGVNWDDVLNKKVPPPYVPDIRGRFDVSNFDPEFTNEKPGLTPTNTIIDSHDQKEFSNFDYVSPWAGVSEKWTR